MRLWVFVRSPYTGETTTHPIAQASQELYSEQKDVPEKGFSCQGREDIRHTAHSLSVVLPVYNEEDALATTLADVLDTLKAKVADFEVILVNDGSSDRTGDILAALAATIPQVRVVTHEGSQGYGATLADGFAATTKELTLFMDADGQFDIEDLPRLLTFIDDYDAVIGYRIHCQDTWMRKLNRPYRPHFRGDRQQQSLVLWGIWLLTMGVFFSAPASFISTTYRRSLLPSAPCSVLVWLLCGTTSSVPVGAAGYSQ